MILSGLDPSVSQGIGVVGGLATAGALFPVLTQLLGYSASQGLTQVVSLGYMLARYYFGNLEKIKPAAVIAGIPLGTVEELSHGISDREVRYRANGGVFLAHQDGGNESLRIVGKAWGANRFLFLNMLDFLFLYGSKSIIDVFKEARTYIQGLTLPTTTTLAPIVPTITVDPWQEFEENNLDIGYNEFHATFPIITKNRIYLSMYIETFSWAQNIDEEGRACVTYTIFFRKYEPEPPYEFAKMRLPSTKTGEAGKEIVVWKRKEAAIPRIWTSAIKFSAEAIPTMMVAQSSQGFTIDDFVLFGAQMMKNFMGVDLEERGKIPGIIEQRFF